MFDVEVRVESERQYGIKLSGVDDGHVRIRTGHTTGDGGWKETGVVDAPTEPLFRMLQEFSKADKAIEAWALEVM